MAAGSRGTVSNCPRQTFPLPSQSSAVWGQDTPSWTVAGTPPPPLAFLCVHHRNLLKVFGCGAAWKSSSYLESSVGNYFCKFLPRSIASLHGLLYKKLTVEYVNELGYLFHRYNNLRNSVQLQPREKNRSGPCRSFISPSIIVNRRSKNLKIFLCFWGRHKFEKE